MTAPVSPDAVPLPVMLERAKAALAEAGYDPDDVWIEGDDHLIVRRYVGLPVTWRCAEAIGLGPACFACYQRAYWAGRGERRTDLLAACEALSRFEQDCGREREA